MTIVVGARKIFFIFKKTDLAKKAQGIKPKIYPKIILAMSILLSSRYLYGSGRFVVTM
jgi:hypothetical protein